MTTASRKEQKIIAKLLAKPIAKVEVQNEQALTALAYRKVGVFNCGHIEAFVKSPQHVDSNLLSTINEMIASNKSKSIEYEDKITPIDPCARVIEFPGKPSEEEAKHTAEKYKNLLRKGNANLPAKTVMLNIFTLAPLVTLHALIDSNGRNFHVRLYQTTDISGSTDNAYNYKLTRLMEVKLRQDMDGAFTTIGSNFTSIRDQYPQHLHPGRLLGIAIAHAIVISSEPV